MATRPASRDSALQMAEHAAVACKGSGALVDPEARKVALGRVYSLLLRLAHEPRTAEASDDAEPEPLTTDNESGQAQETEMHRSG